MPVLLYLFWRYIIVRYLLYRATLNGLRSVQNAFSHTYLESTTAAALHQIADMSWFNTCSNEWIYVVMIQFLQLQT